VKLRLVVTTLMCGALVTACSDKPATPGVPTLAGSAGPGATNAGDGPNPNGANGDGSAERRSKLHAAAQCVREHGAPNYQDPVLTADGRVYTDEVALRELEEQQMEAIQTACADLIRAASFAIEEQAPPPPAVVQAGVKSAECLRAHGLPNTKDPTANSRFTPGKGFGLDPEGLPPGGKADPTVQRALEECKSVFAEEQRVSSLGSLAHA
jgi:hypothetical protein